jgi:hypothetical protein
MDGSGVAKLRAKQRSQECTDAAMNHDLCQTHSAYMKKTKKPRRQKMAARVEAMNWQKHQYHADFEVACSKDRINYDQLGTDDLDYDFLIQDEYASSWIYPINLLMEDGRLCTWKGELVSESPHRALDLGPLLDDALRKRSGQMREDLQRHGWSIIENSCVSTSEAEWDSFEDFEMV